MSEELLHCVYLNCPLVSFRSECDVSRHGSSLDESATGLEVVGLHCRHKKNWKLRVGDF